jgi:predicted TIM-barrel fold metal-dependent hydrolase
MNRREFVSVIGSIGAGASLASMTSAAGARLLAQGPPGLLGSAAVRPEWLDRRKEAALEPELPIIDPHRHLWIRGLTFDTQVYHPQLDDLGDLAAAFPALSIVANHCGTPLGIGAYAGKRDDVFARWSASLKRLAAHPNVYLKVGGLGMRYLGLGFAERAEPPSSEDVAAVCRPWVDTCLQAFGATRCMFESNFPVDKVSYSYPVFWNAYKRLVRGASASEKAALFAGTSHRVYRMADITLA